MTKKKALNIAFTIISFCFMLYIMTCVPFTRDDWAWGASVGAQRLASGFKNYNGRYLGDLLILLLTKSNAIKSIGMSIISFSVPYLVYKYVCKNESFYFLFSMLLLFIMPSNIFRQTMGWASGLANYIPPIALTILYLSLIQNVFKENPPVYKKYLPPITFLIGICANLFMEHVTILNLVLSIGIIVYTYVRFKKFYLSHIAFFAGSIVGAIIMFTNSAYGIIASGDDFYRSVAQESSVFTQAIENAKIIYTRSIESNTYLNVVITILLICLVKGFLKKSNIKGKRKTALITVLGINTGYTTWCLIKTLCHITDKSINTPISHIIRGIFAVIFIINLILIPALTINDKNKLIKTTAPIACTIVLCAPLLVVSPVTGRCFYPVYVMLMIYTCEVMMHIINESKNKKKLKKNLTIALAILLTFIAVFYCVTFTQISSFEKERTQYVTEQVESGATTVYIPNYPTHLQLFTEGTTPESTLWQTRYKDFHNIDKSVKLTPISYKEYKELSK